jgi:hypothetical protein
LCFVSAVRGPKRIRFFKGRPAAKKGSALAALSVGKGAVNGQVQVALGMAARPE